MGRTLANGASACHRAAVRPVLLLIVAVPTLGGCATTSRACREVQGFLPLGRTALPPDRQAALGLAQLQCSADLGAAPAQLALGIAYESGDGVPVDLARAARLYQAAATDVPARTAIYVPGVGKAPGRVQMFDTPGGGRTGLADARYRLGLLYLEGRGVEANPDHGWSLIDRAARTGHPQALRRLLDRPAAR